MKMKLREFIQKLKKIESEQGEDIEVVMADNIPIVSPVFLDNFFGKKVIITDQE
jgi:deoxyhypusine synthase